MCILFCPERFLTDLCRGRGSKVHSQKAPYTCVAYIDYHRLSSQSKYLYVRDTTMNRYIMLRKYVLLLVCVCVCMCVRARGRACVRVRVRACVCMFVLPICHKAHNVIF